MNTWGPRLFNMEASGPKAVNRKPNLPKSEVRNRLAGSLPAGAWFLVWAVGRGGWDGVV